MRALTAPHMGAGVAACRITDVEEASRESGYLHVSVRAGSLNPADLKLLSGEFAARFLHAKVRPLIVGYDFAGVVTESDPGAAISEGDEVVGFLPYAGSTRGGTLAESVVVAADEIGTKPPSVSFVDAASAATAGCTALQGLRDILGVQAGQRVLVNGASGGVGIFAVQIAKQLGASVVATCSAAKADAVDALGADDVVDYRKVAIADLDGPFDAIFDAAAASSFAECTAVMTEAAGYLTTLPGAGLLIGKIRAAFSARRCDLVIVKSTPADLEQLCACLADGSLRVHQVVHRLDDATKALELLSSGRAVGKVGIEIGS